MTQTEREEYERRIALLEYAIQGFVGTTLNLTMNLDPTLQHPLAKGITNNAAHVIIREAGVAFDQHARLNRALAHIADLEGRLTCLGAEFTPYTYQHKEDVVRERGYWPYYVCRYIGPKGWKHVFYSGTKEIV